jgi:hypothetical protein
MHRGRGDRAASDEPIRTSAGGGSAVPKIIGVMIAVGLLRAIVGHRRRHGGPDGWRDRRREMIATLHRQLHEEEAALASKATSEAPAGA